MQIVRVLLLLLSEHVRRHKIKIKNFLLPRERKKRRERKEEKATENIKVKSIKLFAQTHIKSCLGGMYKTYDFWHNGPRGPISFVVLSRTNGKTKAEPASRRRVLRPVEDAGNANKINPCKRAAATPLDAVP